MAELFLDDLDKPPALTIITNDGRAISVDDYFVHMNPTLLHLIEDTNITTLDIREMTDSCLLKQILNYGMIKVMDKWCSYTHSKDEEFTTQKLKDKKLEVNLFVNEVPTKWTTCDLWQTKFIDKMIDIGYNQQPPFELFSKVFALADYLGNQKMCHGLLDRWVNYLHTNGHTTPASLSHLLQITDTYDKEKQEKEWNKYKWN